jgi:hypothetical protein
MCPICRNNGGLLPIIQLDDNNELPIKGIHKIIISKSVNNLNNTLSINICGIKLKTKDGFCQVIGKEKYGGLCGIHCKNK